MRTSSVKSKDIVAQSNRFEGKYWLNDFSYYSNQVTKSPNGILVLNDIAEVFNPPVFKRQFCKNTPRAVQYFQSSDVQMAEERSSTYVFKGQAESLNLLVNQGDILVTGFGTIGNTRLVSKYQDGTCYANNVCRIRVFEGQKNGFIYAFMSSRYGYSQLNKNASGSVVRYIEAPGIKKTIIPNFPESFQTEIDDLIQESARLREEATEALDSAKSLITQFCNKSFKKEHDFKSSSVKLSSIRDSFNTRLDPPVFINEGVKWLSNIDLNVKRLGDCNIKTWYPGIFKRAYVANGLPYIKGASLFVTNPFQNCDYLSKSRTPHLEDLWLKEGMILISCAGICGQVKMITKEYEEKQSIGSPDIIRLTSSDPIFTKEYLFAYLQLPEVYEYMQSLKYGSVIERFDSYNLENIPVVEPTKELSEKVTQIVQIYMDCTYRAFIAEETAISKVEQEIERWNHQ